jgi:hypothetical protein
MEAKILTIIAPCSAKYRFDVAERLMRAWVDVVIIFMLLPETRNLPGQPL